VFGNGASLSTRGRCIYYLTAKLILEKGVMQIIIMHIGSEVFTTVSNNNKEL
jgi:hypothetical protein